MGGARFKLQAHVVNVGFATHLPGNSVKNEAHEFYSQTELMGINEQFRRSWGNKKSPDRNDHHKRVPIVHQGLLFFLSP
jgi:hypothetical protein